MIPDTARPTLHSRFSVGLSRCLAPKIRSMREFADTEIVIPDGRFEGRRYNTQRQPYSRLWFDLVDSGRWNRFAATGPTQSGKTLSCFIIPTLYHLFEVQETVICGVPQMEMAKDKWNEDLLPAIEKSRYRDLLPLKGAGSKGGAVESIRFRNGNTLKFMSGGGSDKKRSAFTSRVAVITEADGMDEAGETSRETDPITQIEARTLSYGSLKRLYLECTVSIEQGCIWTEYLGGTETRIAVPCHACGEHVTPEREDLYGWHDAANAIEARERAHFVCPSCGVLWNDHRRREANANAIALHRGQKIEAGQLTGEAPKTNTLGFRWNAFNNLFWDTADIAAGEWQASKAENEENAEKERLQFIWTKPHKPDINASVPIDAKNIIARAVSFRRGMIPPGTLYLTVGCDLGMYCDHWVCVAWIDDGTCHVVDHGTIDVNSRTIGVERATVAALNDLQTLCEFGWENVDHTRRRPDRVMIDSGYQTPEVYRFVNEIASSRYWAVDGRGEVQGRSKIYTHPSAKNDKHPLIGENYHISIQPDRTMLMAIDSNEWKTWVHKRLTTPLGKPGAMTLFDGDVTVHGVFAKHLTAERQVEQFIAGKGQKILWEHPGKHNHWFDAIYYASAGGHLAGWRLIKAKPIEQPKTTPVTETERPFVRKIETRESDGGWIRRRSK